MVHILSTGVFILQLKFHNVQTRRYFNIFYFVYNFKLKLIFRVDISNSVKQNIVMTTHQACKLRLLRSKVSNSQTTLSKTIVAGNKFNLSRKKIANFKRVHIK